MSKFRVVILAVTFFILALISGSTAVEAQDAPEAVGRKTLGTFVVDECGALVEVDNDPGSVHEGTRVELISSAGVVIIYDVEAYSGKLSYGEIPASWAGLTVTVVVDPGDDPDTSWSIKWDDLGITCPPTETPTLTPTATATTTATATATVTNTPTSTPTTQVGSDNDAGAVCADDDQGLAFAKAGRVPIQARSRFGNGSFSEWTNVQENTRHEWKTGYVLYQSTTADVEMRFEENGQTVVDNRHFDIPACSEDTTTETPTPTRPVETPTATPEIDFCLPTEPWLLAVNGVYLNGTELEDVIIDVEFNDAISGGDGATHRVFQTGNGPTPFTEVKSDNGSVEYPRDVKIKSISVSFPTRMGNLEIVSGISEHIGTSASECKEKTLTIVARIADQIPSPTPTGTPPPTPGGGVSSIDGGGSDASSTPWVLLTLGVLVLAGWLTLKRRSQK